LRDAQTSSFDEHPFMGRNIEWTDSNDQARSTASNPRNISTDDGLHDDVSSYDTGAGRVANSTDEVPYARRITVTLAVLLIAVAGTSAWYYAPTLWHRTSKPPLQAKVVPFATFPGAMGQPAFSPDGDRIAFTWDGGDLKNVDIYVKLIGAGSPLRLTTSPAQDTTPVWSPDGRYLAFVRHADGQNILMTVPALGGSERKVAVCASTIDPYPLSWSPDGKYLAITDHAGENERFSIYLIAADDGEKRRLTTPPEATGDTAAAFSPDY
jgi:hypothetical protein